MTDEDPVAELRVLVRAIREQARRIDESGAFGVARGAWPRSSAGQTSPPGPLSVSGEGEGRQTRVVSSQTSPPGPLSVSGEGEGRQTRVVSSEPAARQRGPALPMMERVAVLSGLAAEVATCTKCRLHEGRTRSVFARGSPSARLVFVGEGPGRDEDLQGAPFVGPAGQLLDKMIQGMGLSDEQVYICNVVKCRPPNNRVPMADEAACCEPFLTRQIDIVRPEVIVALGKTAVSFLLGLDEPMGRLRGRWHVYQDTPVMPTFHPAFLLRSPQYKREVWDDLKLVLARLGLTPPSKSRA